MAAKATGGAAHKDLQLTLLRGLDVIRAFGPERPYMTLSECATATGLTRAAARRFLLTLKHAGYVRNDDGKYFCLSPHLLELGHAYLSSQPWWTGADAALERLSAKTGESCSMGVLAGPDVVCVRRIPVRRGVSVNLDLGTRLAAADCAMGQVLLAHGDRPPAKLAAVRLRGHAVVQDDIDRGVRSVAVPVFNRRGQILAALNVETPAGRAGSETTQVAALQVAAREISATLRQRSRAARPD
jgi:IclR family pca regulon transcriptional regulator